MQEFRSNEFKVRLKTSIDNLNSIEYKYVVQPYELDLSKFNKSMTNREQCYNRTIPKDLCISAKSLIKLKDSWGQNKNLQIKIE